VSSPTRRDTLVTLATAALRFKSEQPRRRRLEGDEEKRLLDYASTPRIKAFTIAAIETGCRVGELRALQWKHVNLARCLIELPGVITKPAVIG